MECHEIWIFVTSLSQYVLNYGSVYENLSFRFYSMCNLNIDIV